MNDIALSAAEGAGPQRRRVVALARVCVYLIRGSTQPGIRIGSGERRRRTATAE